MVQFAASRRRKEVCSVTRPSLMRTWPRAVAGEMRVVGYEHERNLPRLMQVE
jgi:hypothetical protein